MKKQGGEQLSGNTLEYIQVSGLMTRDMVRVSFPGTMESSMKGNGNTTVRMATECSSVMAIFIKASGKRTRKMAMGFIR